MQIKELIKNLSVFVDTFNKRPDVELYYSEKLLTLKQKQDYEKTIQYLKDHSEKK